MAIEKVAFNLGRNDEEPNINLANELSNSKNRKGIKEIVDGLYNENEQIANDCIKVLYEIGERDPKLITEYVSDFIKLLRSKNNRLIWGSMTALAKIASLKTKEIYQNIEIIKRAYEKGSVITVDNSISVFAEICRANTEYEKVVFPILAKHLKECRPKEVPQHCERAIICINKDNAQEFINILKERITGLSETQQKRVSKIIRKAEKI